MDNGMTTFIQENLNGYNLPQDTLVELHSILMRRFSIKFSEGLSPEGRMAMELTAMTGSIINSGNYIDDNDSEETSTYMRRSRQKRRSKTISITGSFEKESANKEAAKANGLKTRRSSSAGIIKELETSAYGANSVKFNTEQVERETDKIQSVEKCLVWMEAQNRDPTENIHII
ncbi:uncharacterized protein LOC132718851 [Ruditapes philippinarum]|uniref:uncharacterized protein LOC132718851 n=1 Tax=Ruditapes philippinarum TaxID=129788 RepID=UPI00295A7884|nr:uncharacterized protein LOC132718851 [Ruditapes philippinarum]